MEGMDLARRKEIENCLHRDAIMGAWGVDFAFGDFDDVPLFAAQVIHEETEGAKPWSDVSPKDRCKKESRVKLGLK